MFNYIIFYNSPIAFKIHFTSIITCTSKQNRQWFDQLEVGFDWNLANWLFSLLAADGFSVVYLALLQLIIVVTIFNTSMFFHANGTLFLKAGLVFGELHLNKSLQLWFDLYFVVLQKLLGITWAKIGPILMSGVLASYCY